MFKKILIAIGILSTLVLSPMSVFAEKINTYKVNVKIEESGDVSVTERISYDFENSIGKHGIYRSIPLETGNRKIVLKDVTVYEEGGLADGADIKFENNNLNLKIGDINKIVSGVHDYVINYKIERPFVNKNDKENLFFNVIGADWSVPINNSSFLVELPLPLSKNEIDIKCFVGENLSTNTCNSPKLSLDKHGLVTAFLVDSINLKPYEGVTLELSIPKSSLVAIPFIDKCINLIRIFWPFLIVGILGIIFLIVWYKEGRDAKGTGIIIPEYEVPENLHPLMVSGILRKGRFIERDFAAHIVYLADLGYISIEVKRAKRILNIKMGKDVCILKLEKPYVGANPLDKDLLNGLFEGGNRVPGDTVDISTLKNIAGVWNDIKQKVKFTLIQEKYFTKSLNRFNLEYHLDISKKFSLIIVITFTAFFLVNILGIEFIPLVFNFVDIIISTVVIILFYCIFMYAYPAKTEKGLLMEERIEGFKMYLSIAEKHRIHFENPPDVTSERFLHFLPYAIVLGVENAWAKSIRFPENQNPSWWHDDNGFHFHTSWIIHDMVAPLTLHNIFNRVVTDLNSRSDRSSFGGFGGGSVGGSVGGGVGGGGGGSW